ncbi:hypothetical protein [Nitrobacter sp. TKz-YC01]|uniref:hypothetical protein n=1 Tax=Nitrobacter sp. TKz-YC01 TaxID=3398703 RepID=UPI003A101C46
MANDKPTSLRMGFGYGQARAAGLGGVRADRSTRQVNKITKENKSTRTATLEIREFAKDPDWAPLIKHLVSQGLSPKDISDELYWVKRYAWSKAKGHSLAFRLKFHWRG